ncbi:hypothetical protein [Cupriavidus sp. UME77]|nr:hypothetical protein [Cupriavidus sp. UME77]
MFNGPFVQQGMPDLTGKLTWVMMLDRLLAALRPLQELQSKEDDSL